MKFYTIMIALVFLSSCRKSEPIVISPDDYHNAVDKVVDIMVHDIFSPPVASRIFAYPNIAYNRENQIRSSFLSAQLVL